MKLFPGYSFLGALESAEKFIQNICRDKFSLGLSCELTIVAHSYASHYALELARSQKDIVKEMILISPALNIKDVDKNILQLAVSGLKDEGQVEASEELSKKIPTLNESFDAKKVEAFSLASQ